MMAIIEAPASRPSALEPIASWRHTGRFTGILLLLAMAQFVLQRSWSHAASSQGRFNHIPLYVCLLASEWMLFRVVRGGLRSAGHDWRELIGLRSPARVMLDALIAVAFFAGSVLAIATLAHFSGVHSSGAARVLLPRGTPEVLLWIALSISAGFCEEITFRGYFQRQFAALTQSVWAGLFLQALLFGIMHIYQGLPAALAISAFGVFLGLLAMWRKSLRPGILAHVLNDIVFGIFGRA